MLNYINLFCEDSTLIIILHKWGMATLPFPKLPWIQQHYYLWMLWSLLFWCHYNSLPQTKTKDQPFHCMDFYSQCLASELNGSSCSSLCGPYLILVLIVSNNLFDFNWCSIISLFNNKRKWESVPWKHLLNYTVYPSLPGGSRLLSQSRLIKSLTLVSFWVFM